MKRPIILLCALISFSASAANPVLKDYKGFFRADNPAAEIYSGFKVDCPRGTVTATTIGNTKVSVSYASSTTSFSVRGSFDGTNVVIEKQLSTVNGMSGIENTAYATLDGDKLIGYGWQSVPIYHDWYRYFGKNKVCKGTYELREVPRY
jgi:hypothetical protein|tara:strand:+ start:42 stop:488 length:447 start_codon:yes stop_codon:yes gene_type:complete